MNRWPLTPEQWLAFRIGQHLNMPTYRPGSVEHQARTIELEQELAEAGFRERDK